MEKITKDIEEKLINELNKVLKKLWQEMSVELKLYGSGKNEFTPALLISKIKDYNRKWNVLAENNLLMKPDGFKKIAKMLLTEERERPLGKNFQDALKYL